MNEELRNATGETHGFSWSLEPVSKQAGANKSDRMELGKGPIMVVTDITKFEATFPGAILASLDGSSIRVEAQSVVRRMLAADKSVSVDEMKDAVVNKIRGIRNKSRGTTVVTKFIGLDGQGYNSELEKKQADLAHLVDQGVEPQMARTILGL